MLVLCDKHTGQCSKRRMRRTLPDGSLEMYYIYTHSDGTKEKKVYFQGSANGEVILLKLI